MTTRKDLDMSTSHAVEHVGLQIAAKDRRRRLARPPTLVFFGALFIALPVLNYFAAAFALGRSPADIEPVLRGLGGTGLIGLALWILPLPVGLGLLSVQRWGWWLFAVYAPALSVYNVIIFANSPTAYNVGAIVQTVVGLSAMAYFLRRDVYAPYWSETSRGWRRAARHALEIPVVIDGEQFVTRDFAERGCFAKWPDCERNPGSSVRVEFTLGEHTFALAAGIARIESDGVALAFRDIDDATAKKLESGVKAARKAKN